MAETTYQLRSGDEPADGAPSPRRDRWGLVPGLALTGAGVVASWGVHALVPQVGLLTWAVLAGALVANLGLLPTVAAPGVRFATRRLLRIGVVLLGLSLPLAAIVALGFPVVGLVVVTLTATLLGTWWLGTRMGLGRPRSLLIACGFAICGASAIAATQDAADADEDDVATAISMVTICGTAAMVLLPLLQAPLGLSDRAFGIWAGASVHEVGQVVAAATPVGATAVSIAVVVKLTRVLMLAPVVTGLGLLGRRDGTRGTRPPLLPLFVAGFLVMVAVRSSGLLPTAALDVAETAQDVAFAAALFGLGTGVHLRSLVRSSGSALLLATAATLLVATVALFGVLLVG